MRTIFLKIQITMLVLALHFGFYFWLLDVISRYLSRVFTIFSYFFITVSSIKAKAVGMEQRPVK